MGEKKLFSKFSVRALFSEKQNLNFLNSQILVYLKKSNQGLTLTTARVCEWIYGRWQQFSGSKRIMHASAQRIYVKISRYFRNVERGSSASFPIIFEKNPGIIYPRGIPNRTAATCYPTAAALTARCMVEKAWWGSFWHGSACVFERAELEEASFSSTVADLEKSNRRAGGRKKGAQDCDTDSQRPHENIHANENIYTQTLCTSKKTPPCV